MTVQLTAHTPTRNRARTSLARLWRGWWLRAAKAQQRRCLERVLMDPHMARDLGLPVAERPVIRPELW